MNDNKVTHPSDDIADDICSNSKGHKIIEEQTNHTSLYTLANNKLQLSYHLEDPNKANDWKRTNSYKGELVIAYNRNTRNNALHPGIFYALYIGPNDNGNGHLIYKLSTDQIVVTMKYQSVLVPKDLIKAMNETDLSDNKIQVNHFDSNHSIVRNN